jgi:opacity protein-like surface antigen
MKRRILCTFLLSFALVLSAPFLVFGQESPNYVTVKAGIYNPTDDLDDLDRGTNVEVSFGHYFNPNFVLEGGIGKFETDETFSGFDPFVLGSFSEKDEVSVIPLTVNAKRIVPFHGGEGYLGIGIGFYIVDFDADLSSSTLGSASVSLSDTIIGINFLAGLNFNISDKWFLGVEGKYIITQDGKDSDVIFGVPIELEGNINGYTLTGVLGVRF